MILLRFLPIVLLGSLAGAQELIVQKVLPLEAAMKVAQGAMERCKADGYKVSVTIVDASGAVKLQLRGDGTNAHTVELSKQKAYTAMTYKRTSAETLTMWKTAGVFPNIPGTVAIGGGVPIKAGADVIGGIGVSGAPGGEKDEVCADEGIKKIASILK